MDVTFALTTPLVKLFWLFSVLLPNPKAPYLSAPEGLICADPSGRCCGAGLCRAEFVPDGGPRCSNKFKQNQQRKFPKYKARHTHHETTVTISTVSAVSKDATATASQIELSPPQSQGEEDFAGSNTICQEPKCNSLVP